MKIFTELKIAGDAYPGGFATGLTMHGSAILIDQPETRYNALKGQQLVIREYKKMPQVITARTLNMMRQLTSVNAVMRYVAR